MYHDRVVFYLENFVISARFSIFADVDSMQFLSYKN